MSSPGDNTGAVVDTNILNKMCESEAEFLMEVTEKTRADVKGGTLIWYENKLRLLELAQVPRQYQEEFKSVKKFNVFNTNNIWWDSFFLLQSNTLRMLKSKDFDFIVDVLSQVGLESCEQSDGRRHSRHGSDCE